MKVDLESVLALLHQARYGVLATHSLQLQGFPYATPVPYVLDECHRPVLCIRLETAQQKPARRYPRKLLRGRTGHG